MRPTTLKTIILLCFILIFNSCSVLIVEENDVSNLSENYFICDSVESTPILYNLIWDPDENDSVMIKVSGPPCSYVGYESGWLKTKDIQINLDAKKSDQLLLKLRFGYSSKNGYQIRYNVLIDGIRLMERECFVEKDNRNIFTEYVDRVFLPLFRLDKFTLLGGTKKICNDFPLKDISFLPHTIDSLDGLNSCSIRDYFTISVKSNHAKISLYDKFSNEDVGIKVEARVNDFSRYQLLLLEPYNSEIPDTVIIAFQNYDFVNQCKMYVTNSCLQSKPLKRIKIRLEKSEIYPGDTINVSIHYIDDTGKELSFDSTARFEAGLVSGCESALVLNNKGEMKKYFEEICEPIRLVILDSVPWDVDNNIQLHIGYLPKDDEE